MNLARRLYDKTLPLVPLARRLLPLAALAALGAIALQFLFAGMGVFGATIGDIRGFDAHFWWGGAVHMLLGLVLGLGIVARQPRGALLINGALFGVATLMMALPRLSAVELRAFHPLGAMVVVWLTVVVYQRARAAAQADTAESPEGAPALAPR